jgi:hypothetical protein
VVLLSGSATASVAGYEGASLGPGRLADRPTGDTVVSVQGFHFDGRGNEKKPARLVSITAGGEVDWVYNGSRTGARWFYDVDPLDNGTLLVTATVPGETVVFLLDRETRERVWTERLDADDTHDVDWLGDGRLLVAEMRNYDEAAGVNRDRIFVYDRGRDEIVWQWQLRRVFSPSDGGDYTGDWSHLNDVDRIAPGRYLVSARNMDQVLVVDRETKRVVDRLGADGDYDRLHEQHNPDWLAGEDGRPAILVADSENDRIVEYSRENGTWNRTWELTGNLSWPRDADRLPNGNTLVTDTLHHRVIEVTPRGEVVWEYRVPWAPYDSERPAHGGGSTGPTVAEMNATGSYVVHGGNDSSQTRTGVGEWLADRGFERLGDRYAHVMPFVRPVWVPSWAWAQYVLAALLVLGWGGVELLLARR